MNQLVNSLHTSDKTKLIMIKIDRFPFYIHKEQSYVDKPSPLFMNQTISAPHMHAKAIEYLEDVLLPGNSILDIGSGSGYLTACFAEAVKVYHQDEYYRGKVIGLEIIPDLVNYSLNIIQNNFKYLMKYKRNFKLLHIDGKFGYPKHKNQELYDGIHIGAACDYIPYFLFQQLKKGGIMVIPLKIKENQFIFTIVKKDSNGNIFIEQKQSVRYVPLI